MTPFYLNPPSSTCPLVEQAEDQQHLKLFISPYQASSSLLSPAFFKTTQDERGSEFVELSQHDEKADNPISHGSCDHLAFSSSSVLRSVAEDSNNGHKFPICEREDGDRSKSHDGSAQWVDSKVRLLQKMMNPNCPATERPLRITQKCQNQQHEDSKINSNISNNTVRVCTDCNTTTTPLWRGGPRGPKSLCNACGIRQRKARRAMAEAAAAANGLAVGTDVSSMKSKVHNKGKKTRTSHNVAQFKNKCKLTNSSHGEKKLSFKDFALSLSNNSAFGVFPQDEAEAAILLMELSCGLVHT